MLHDQCIVWHSTIRLYYRKLKASHMNHMMLASKFYAMKEVAAASSIYVTASEVAIGQRLSELMQILQLIKWSVFKVSRCTCSD